MRYILFAIFLFVLYQLIFNLVIPVYQTSQKIKKGFREMNSRMDQQQTTQNHSKRSAPKAKAGDYIDFEEIKQ